MSDTIYYNLRVAGSLLKQVYVAEGLAPPTNLNTLREAYSTIYKRASDASYWSKVSSDGQWKKIAIYGVEALGIFTIGEMVSCAVEHDGSARGIANLPPPSDRTQAHCWLQAKQVRP